VNIVKGTYDELIAFVVLNMWPSHLGLPILLAIVVFSKTVQRHPTFINLLIAFIVIGISSSLLVYSGNLTGAEPPKTLCLVQSSLLYGMPALTSTAVFCLVYQMFTVIRTTFNGEDIPKQRSAGQLLILLAAPWVAWVICIVSTVWIGVSNLNKVSRNRRFFYCSLESMPLTNTLTITAAIILLATIVLEVWTAVLFFRRWRYARRGNQMSSVNLNLPVRILAFGLYLAMCLSLSLVSINSPQSPVPDLAIATAASVVILIFGTQPDILRTICFWKKDQSAMHELRDHRYGGKLSGDVLQ